MPPLSRLLEILLNGSETWYSWNEFGETKMKIVLPLNMRGCFFFEFLNFIVFIFYTGGSY